MLYGGKATGKFPLILIMGREPNDANPVGVELGRYDFNGIELVDGREMRRSGCTFWNRSYKLIGEYGPPEPISSGLLKQKCRKFKSSIIAFADISSFSTRSGVKTKAERRADISYRAFKVHLDALLNRKVWDRCQLILVSGLAEDGLYMGREVFMSHANARKHDAFLIPFLSTYSYRDVRSRAQGTPRLKRRLRTIYQQWLEYQGVLG